MLVKKVKPVGDPGKKADNRFSKQKRYVREGIRATKGRTLDLVVQNGQVGVTCPVLSGHVGFQYELSFWYTSGRAKKNGA